MVHYFPKNIIQRPWDQIQNIIFTLAGILWAIAILSAIPLGLVVFLGQVLVTRAAGSAKEKAEEESPITERGAKNIFRFYWLASDDWAFIIIITDSTFWFLVGCEKLSDLREDDMH